MRSDGNCVPDDHLITRREAAKTLGLQPQTMARWAMTGQHLPVVKIGRNVRYRLSDVKRLMDATNAPTQN